jgi:transposase
MQITTIGIDLSKTVFQIHAVDADGKTVVRKRLRRAEVLSFFAGLEPCLIGMEACATSHYWARELTKFGHTVKLMPPAYVKPYVKRGKNDATDAEAICEAVSRPNMRFVPVKSADQQAVLMLHRTRALLIRQQTMLANAFRAHLAEFGIVVAQGIRQVRALIERVFGEGAPAIDLPAPARIALRPLVAQLMELRLQIKTIEKELLAWHRTSQESRRLETIPGVGFITATAIAATVTDPSHFRSSREFAAWLGLTPRQNSSGGKDRLGRVLFAFSHCRRSHGDDPLCPRKRRGQRPMDQWAAGEEAGPSRLGCGRQQDGEDRLGAARQEGRLSGSGALHRVSNRLEPITGS